MNLYILWILATKAEFKNSYSIFQLSSALTNRQISQLSRTMIDIIKNKSLVSKSLPSCDQQIENIKFATQILLDPYRRRAYDLYGLPGLEVYETNLMFPSFQQIASSFHSSKITTIGKNLFLRQYVPLSFIIQNASYLLIQKHNAKCQCQSMNFFCYKCQEQPYELSYDSYAISGFLNKDGIIYQILPYSRDSSIYNNPGHIIIQLIPKIDNQNIRLFGLDIHCFTSINFSTIVNGGIFQIFDMNGNKNSNFYLHPGILLSHDMKIHFNGGGVIYREWNNTLNSGDLFYHFLIDFDSIPKSKINEIINIIQENTSVNSE